MTTKHEATEGGQAAALPEGVRPALFQPFERIRGSAIADLPALEPMTFAEHVADVAAGTCVLLQLMEANDLAQDQDEPRLLDDFAVNQLRRLAIASMRLVEDRAHDLIDWADRYHKRDATSGSRP